ncbi:hypothetical protein ASG25_09170 [Rhizobium sp. Leaf384]|uniref:hypothetical protein n=1 Tax=Rhizobium sp. Leaf384 TaxID=1736358 RepID=UPI00071388A8|nr:hypothetical protein [Rhizobium sp. Leaf384]KQS78805.1 hypothetical protein ASG25_09170 [Rhizobium sp. Leaf384]
MGEFQNRAIKMLQLTESVSHLTDTVERQRQFLENAVRLYLAIGGKLTDFTQLEQPLDKNLKVGKEIGSMIIELSALSNLHDMDMMQAAKIELERRVSGRSV